MNAVIDDDATAASMSDFLFTIESEDEAPAADTVASKNKSQKESKKRKREELAAEKPRQKGAASEDFVSGFTFDNFGAGASAGSNGHKDDVWVS